MSDFNPYVKCPVYTTESFVLRLVEAGDAEALLECYSDPAAVAVMNSDYCTCDFHFTTLAQMRDCIALWLEAYTKGHFVRFSVLDKRLDRPVGTVEIFGGLSGVLRIDLKRKYEEKGFLLEILGLCGTHLFDAFHADNIIVKAVPAAEQRVAALLACGFVPDDRFRPQMDYFLLSR